MVTDTSFPSEFIIPSIFAGSSLTENLKDGFYLTQKLKFLNKNANISVAREIKDTVAVFEDFYSKTPESDIGQVSIPLFIVFSCQSRKKRNITKWKAAWQKLVQEEQGFPPVPSDGEFATYNKDSDIPEKVKYVYVKGKDGQKGDFVYNSFHTSIIILCNGKVYTVGYGLDPLFDQEMIDQYTANKNIISGDIPSNIKVIQKLREAEKGLNATCGNAFSGVNLFGTGFLYSPDSLDIEHDLNYAIIDIGILTSNHIIRLEKMFANITRLKTNTMVTGKDTDQRSVAIEQFMGQTLCIYSRLSSTLLQNIPFTGEFMNCSSFVENIFFDRITSKSATLNSDPNKCRKLNQPYSTGGSPQPDTIFKAYFGTDITVAEFAAMVSYVLPRPSIFQRISNLPTGFLASIKLPSMGSPIPDGSSDIMSRGGDATANEELKLKKRKKHKRPINTTARKLNNK
jgi:hypothetical protein